MNSTNNFLFLSIMLFLSLLVGSCGDASTPNAELTATPAPFETETTISTRGNQQHVAIKAYHYKTLAAFKKGETEISLNDLAALAGKQINLVILYESVAPWAAGFNEGKYQTTGNDHFNGLMESYDLDIVKQFAIDMENEGLVLEPNAILSDPVEAAKELSMIDHVLMVEVKEVPNNELDESTAGIK
ncbi:MAG: hypothetical protein ACRBFS_06905 [Aureispira sp.]